MGMIWLNSENNSYLSALFGGMKSSGLGRDNGDWTFDFCMKTETPCVV